jgi:energy-coupling factor transporter ATP-binding protein EcfA2
VLRKRLRVLDLIKWRFTMATISKLLPEGRTVLVCGSGGTGKSTFCRASTNRLLADQAFLRHISGSKGGVLLLDLDLTQPELTPPGLIYLAHVKSALLGSPDSHYAMPGSSQNHILRMHYLGGIDVDSVSRIYFNIVILSEKTTQDVRCLSTALAGSLTWSLPSCQTSS